MYIDSHAHINFSQFDEDREDVILRAKNADVGCIINIGIDLRTSRESIQLAEKYDLIYAAVGVHPHDAEKVKPDHWKQLEKMISHPKVVAIGELGLDFYRNYSPRDVQHQVLQRQLQLAVETDMPIIVHTRNAWPEILEIFEGEYNGKLKGVFHCFAGDEKMAQRVLDLGFYISFTGVVTFKNSTALQVAKEIPLNRLMVETDCPFMAPMPFRGKRCEPAYVPLIADKIAEAREIDEEVLARQTSENVRELFGII